MATIMPFRALRYDSARIRLSDVVCPPYDVLTPAQADDYRARSPYNAIHLDLAGGEAQPAGADRYTRSAAELTRWQAEGVLVRDERPGFYLFEHSFREPGGQMRTRRGFFGRVGLEDFAAGVIHPHESTHAGAKGDRVELLRATRTNLSPVFLLHPDEDRRVWRTLESAEHPEPPLEVEGPDGVGIRLQAAVGAGAEEAAALLAGRSLIIADGHHRYGAALAYCRERQAAGDHTADACLAYFCGMDDPGLVIHPTHRLIAGIDVPPLEELRPRLLERFEIVAEVADGIGDPGAMLRRLAEHADAPAFALLLAREGMAVIVKLREKAAVDALVAEGLAPAVAALPVTVLHYLLLRDVFGVPPRGGEGQIEYSRSEDEVVERLRAGLHPLAVLQLAPTIADVQHVVESGQTMPQKTTYFYPKLPTGLLFNPLD